MVFQIPIIGDSYLQSWCFETPNRDSNLHYRRFVHPVVDSWCSETPNGDSNRQYRRFVPPFSSKPRKWLQPAYPHLWCFELNNFYSVRRPSCYWYRVYVDRHVTGIESEETRVGKKSTFVTRDFLFDSKLATGSFAHSFTTEDIENTHQRLSRSYLDVTCWQVITPETAEIIFRCHMLTGDHTRDCRDHNDYTLILQS